MTSTHDLPQHDRLSTTTTLLPSSGRQVSFYGGGPIRSRAPSRQEATAIFALLSWLEEFRSRLSSPPDEALEHLMRGTSWEYETESEGELRGVFAFDHHWSTVLVDQVDLSPGALPKWEPPISFMTAPDDGDDE